MPQLKILLDTVLKQKPLVSTKLADAQKTSIKAGTLLDVRSYVPEQDHLKVTFTQPVKGQSTWYVFQKHLAVVDKGDVIYPRYVKLAVPAYDQLDNSDNPHGSCNVTSIAMCLVYLGAKRKQPDIRFPDELYRYCQANGLSRHEPVDLAKVVTAYGFNDRFTKKATLQEVKEWLVQGNPAVVHGYFTAFGHIIVLIGYNPTGFVVNDPYGELMYNSQTDKYYDTYAPGGGLTYSYNLIRNTCAADGEFWVHFISRPDPVNPPAPTPSPTPKPPTPPAPSPTGTPKPPISSPTKP